MTFDHLHWIFLALCSALLLGVYDLFKKASVRGNAVLPTLFFATLISAVPFALLYAGGRLGVPGVRVVDVLGGEAQLVIFTKSVVVAGSWTCAYFALKHLPISLASPVRASQPAYTILGAVFILGESMRGLQWVGAAVTLVSYFLLSAAGRREGIYFRKNRWVWLMVLATLLGTASALLDKVILRRWPPLEVQTWYSFYLVLVLGVVVLTAWMPGRARHTKFQWRWTIAGIGLALAAADYLYFLALSHPDSLISMITLLRRSSVLVSFGLGGLVFREGNMLRKLPGVLGIVLGLILLCVG